jgi:hypothetical protein
MTFLFAVLLLPILASPGSAQEPSSSEMAAARGLFRSALEHAEAGRWAEARADFERSYALARVPVTLFNLAGARAETGQLVAAAESYRRFLQEAGEGRAARYRQAAERDLAQLEPRIPSVRLEAEGLRDDDTLQIDGDPITRAVLGVAFPLDPGEHRVAVLRGGRTVHEEALVLTEGEARSITLRVPLETAPAAVARATVSSEEPSIPTTSDEPEERGIVRSPWLWIAIGAVVIAGAVTAVVLTTRSDDSPYQGNAGVIRFELGGRR